ncbi:hypothetical protein OF385_04020 [Glutamicibacter sp. JL.03c]|uniref:hypothetical protein n=1 Tax=Glutamicibacter sp. JL.03c TaxID=2984842 RepID=UPI0021F7615B|nr:hypothetical protein [Glutamicibacter sp. JL.03c]UYQ78325.1 hypothetical protein OF385_04020 [Glutamicibacter sp. JL.03c]
MFSWVRLQADSSSAAASASSRTSIILKDGIFTSTAIAEPPATAQPATLCSTESSSNPQRQAACWWVEATTKYLAPSCEASGRTDCSSRPSSGPLSPGH